MSTTVSYKGNTIATVNNNTKTLTTAGKYLEADVVLTDVTSGDTTVNPLSVTSNGTYTAPSGTAYSPVTVNVDGGTPTPSKKWVRPSDWPDLSKMDISGGDVVYMTSYADEARGFCDFYLSCTGQYTVELGHISGLSFIAESSYTYNSGKHCQLYYGSNTEAYKVIKVTGTDITSFTIYSSSLITIDDFKGYSCNQGIIDVVGKLPSGTSLDFRNIYNLINAEITSVKLVSANFSYCYSLTSLDVSEWDTSAITNMSSMFNTCSSLTSLDVSGWDTSKVTNMSYMFNTCYSLTSLDVSSWNTSAVTNINNMFNNCFSITSLDVSSWNMSAVTNMSYMFSSCHSLTSLDVSGWDTSKVTNMSYIFSSCDSLISLDVSSWNTSAVTNMSGMFSSCFSLTSLDVSSWNTSKVTNMSSIFSNCFSLTSLDVSRWVFTKVTTASNAASMFRSCYGLHGSITIPTSITQIGSYFLNGTRSLYEYHFLSATPPTLANTNAFNNMSDYGGKKIYVPAASLEAYKTATNWSTYASYIQEEPN